ncbi:hypothetical protein BB934_43905 (plasmid) [Microvirga ossetica]|uniref:DUF1376 domain-containing protein n=1 Tax=Microvirga ossetica TaxID=1882682 RepID=A0A1B2EYT0_9HYPH|nr:DUF1376 domain-containing protein [Microvirga ossetica]ANY85145.1 hypothetical protein BB934_43905 [Microvirga ossetica]
MSHPWMPFYPGDYLADTVHLSTLEHGAYLMLILHYWRNEGLPDDDTKLARIVRLPLEQWLEIRPTLADFFAPGWRHKRIDTELQVTQEKYQRRAAAGRQGGLASGRAKQKPTHAQAMLQPEQSTAEAGPNQSQSQPQSQSHQGESQSATPGPTGISAEDRFWARLEDLKDKGISRTRCTELLALTGHDFIEANRALDGAEQAAKPGQYLGAIIRNLQQSGKASSPSPQVPSWVTERRATGVLVERDGRHWRCLGELLNEAGEAVGW